MHTETLVRQITGVVSYDLTQGCHAEGPLAPPLHNGHIDCTWCGGCDSLITVDGYRQVCIYCKH